MKFLSFRWHVAKVIAPLLVPLLAVIIWPEFMKLALGSGHAITFVIMAGIVVGAVIISYLSLRINNRWKALARFSAAVEDRDVDWHSMPFVQNTTLGKIVLRQDTLALKQDAIEKDIHDFRIRVYQAQALPDFLVGLMVALGLVGTFIGLIYTLGDIGTMLAQLDTSGLGETQIEQVFGRMVAQLQSPLVAMGTAFAASLFGLIGSILLGLMMVLLRGQVESYLRAVRKFMLKLFDERNRHFSLAQADVVTEEMLSRQVHHLGELIERLGERQGESLRSQEALQRQLSQVGDWQEAALAQVNDTKARTASLENNLAALFERIDAIITATRALTDASAQGSVDLRRTTEVLTSAADTQKAHGLVLEQCVERLAQAPLLLESLQTWNQAVSAHQDARLQAFDAQLQVIRVLLEQRHSPAAAAT